MSLMNLSQFETAFLLSQVFAGFALISDFISFQIKSRVGILILLTISASLLSVHYILLDSVAAAIIVGLSAVRFFVASRSHSPVLMWLFLITSAAGVLATFRMIADFIVLIGSILANIASFSLTDKTLRLFMMAATCCFIIYNIIIFSPVGILVEISFLSSNLLGYYRHYLQKPKFK